MFADTEKLASRSGMDSCKLEGKRKWKRSDAVALQTPQNDRKCKSKLHKDDTKTFNYI